MIHYDYNEAIPVTHDIYWVGYYDEKANIHCNPYLLIDDQEAVIFDPGSIPHFKIVMRKIIDLINPKIITLIVASHQDPDICGNMAVVEDIIENRNLRIAAHKKAIRFLRYYGIRSDFYDITKENYEITLKSGRVLKFIHTPFLHSSGAIATYDSKSGSLFTSDIFGGISDNWDLFANKHYLEAMKTFHQLYMPSNRILKSGLAALKPLKPVRILPQHGSILEGEQIQKSFNLLNNLPCGIDLIENK